jgi:4-diphosphocytidyl-2-C-methyl-D-erythritol kinase
MIVFPNCKINLGLHITRKREDGYHDLETIFYPLLIRDILEFIPAPAFSFQTSGLSIPLEPEQNLCVKAYRLLKSRFSQIPELSIYLHKVIPMGAGLGGGSADGSFILKAMNAYFSLGLQTEELLDLSLQLGSDCPFFIINKPVYARGRGEIMEPLSIDLSGYHIILINPGIQVSTAAAFSGIVPALPLHSLRNRILEPVETWKDWLTNDFEKTVFEQFPGIARIREWLYSRGAIYASMTGSGSSCYGLFRENPDLAGNPEGSAVFHVPAK